MKNLPIVFFICFMVISCSDKKYGDFLDYNIGISYLDNEGNSLLDTQNTNFIDPAEISAYYFIKGENKVIPSRNGAVKLSYYEGESTNIIRLLVSDYFNEDNESITILRFNELDIDTLKCKITDLKHLSYVSKVFYNDKLVYDNNGSNDYIVVVK